MYAWSPTPTARFPFIAAYLTPPEYAALEGESDKSRESIAALIREAVVSLLRERGALGG